MKDNIKWPTSHGMQFPERALKCELYSVILSSNTVAASHEVVRLPPYYCELNPIEMAWVRGYIRSHVYTYA